MKILEKEKIIKENGCWETRRIGNSNGYCHILQNGKNYGIHRISASYFLGLDYNNKTQLALHKNSCNNKRCWNPDHLYVGNRADNLRDLIDLEGHPATRELCRRGHNSWRIKPSGIGRFCVECKKLMQEKINSKRRKT